MSGADLWTFHGEPPADPGFDGQWADLTFLDQPEDPELASFLDVVFPHMASPLVPPYGSPERALHDWTQEVEQ